MKTKDIMSDSLRRDYLGAYGNKWVKTPVLDQFAQKAVVFDKAYAASFPTVPNRADVMLGRHAFTYMRWEPMPRTWPTTAQLLSEAGHQTMMISDTPHGLQNGFFVDRGFTGWQWVRGQESDRARTDYVARELLPCSAEKLRQREKMRRLHYLNVSFRRNERDCFVAQTMASAADWLEANYKHENFMLYVDTFDPHEPWDAPEYYVKMYERGYDGDNVDYPDYVPVDRYKKEEIDHCRNLYAAEVSLVDNWMGEVLRKVERLGIAEETAIIIMSDHGFYLGEHNHIGKFRQDRPMPLYDEVAGIVMLAYVPGSGWRHGEHSSALVQPVDILPTVMELAGKKAPEWAEGCSMVPALKKRGDGLTNRKIAVTTAKLAPAAQEISWDCGGYVSITDGAYTLMYGGAKWPSELYHTEKDKGQTKNVIGKSPKEATRLHGEFVKFLKQLKVEPEILQAYSADPLTAPLD